VECIEDKEALQNFLGTPETPYTALDPEHPVTFGPYMNDPDLINNKKQHSLAMEAARRVIPEVFEELAELTGRSWPVMDAYHMEDAEVAVVMLNSAAETAKEVADRFRRDGHKVGVLSPNVLRPFPTDLIREYLSGVKAIVVGDRADSYGADGGNLSLEVRAAIQVDPDNRTRVLTRIYGLGGKDFDDGDAAEFFSQALEVVKTSRVDEAFAYHGTYAGTQATLGHGRGSRPHCTGARRLSGLRRFSGIEPGLQCVGGRHRGAVPDRLRHGGHHRLPQDSPPGHLYSQPVPERRGNHVRTGGDVSRTEAAG
jgi:pyruvate ferredoxin oxidoreductase alpha subunit